MKRHAVSKQPTITRLTKSEPPHFIIQELPDPEGHLTDEQKTWPIVDVFANCVEAGSKPAAAESIQGASNGVS